MGDIQDTDVEVMLRLLQEERASKMIKRDKIHVSSPSNLKQARERGEKGVLQGSSLDVLKHDGSDKEILEAGDKLLGLFGSRSGYEAENLLKAENASGEKEERQEIAKIKGNYDKISMEIEEIEDKIKALEQIKKVEDTLNAVIEDLNKESHKGPASYGEPPPVKQIYNTREQGQINICIRQYQRILSDYKQQALQAYKSKTPLESVTAITAEHITKENLEAPLTQLGKFAPKTAQYGIIDKMKMKLNKILPDSLKFKEPDKKIVDVLRNEKLPPLTFSRDSHGSSAGKQDSGPEQTNNRSRKKFD